jgi:microcystin degradation protein MlrC
MIRIGYGRIAQETNALSPVKTEFADFTSTHYLEGTDLARACSRFGHEAKGWLRKAELKGFLEAAKKKGDVQAIPLLSAWAVPAGPLSRACYEELEARLIASLKASLPLDGVYLCLHGAMGAEHVRDPEAGFLRAVRSVVGPDVPISVTYDLHGILTEERVRLTNALVAYKTNPHRDHVACGRRAGELLIDAVRGDARPVIAWRSLPMFLGGGTTIDFLAPMRGLYARMRRMEKLPGVLSTSLLSCHPWNSDPSLGWGVAVVADGDQALAERLGDELAEKAWGVRDQLPPRFPAPEEAIAEARAARLARKLGVVVLADASDVVSAGAPGENTILLRALLEQAQGLTCFVPLRDPAVVDACWSVREGETVDVVLGGKLDARTPPLPVRAVLEKKATRHGWGRTLILTAGHVKIVVVEGPALVAQPSFYTGLGLDLWKADVVVVKNFFPFRLFFAPYARKTIYVKTTGVTDFDAAAAMPFDGPMHPRDVVADWREADRRRRAA